MRGSSLLHLQDLAAGVGAGEVTWADAMAAYGTVGAVILSLALGMYGAISASLAKRASRSQEKTRLERLQAEGLHWWHEECLEHRLPYEDIDALSMAYQNLRLGDCSGEVVVIKNTSDAPVHDVVVYTPRYYLPDADVFVPGEIGPDSERVFHVSGFASSLLDPRFAPAGHVSFNDANGLRWKREKSGSLERAQSTAADESVAATELNWLQRRTLDEIAQREDRTNPAAALVREAITWLATSEMPRSDAQRRYAWGVLWRADNAAFALLQELPQRSADRRSAREWLRWRSGNISIETLINIRSVFYPHERREILRARAERIHPLFPSENAPQQ